MALKKAYLKAKREGGDETITVVFNPTEYDVKQNARYTDVKSLGKTGSPMNYIGTDNAEMTFSLTIDGFAMSGDFSDPSDVYDEVKKLMSLVAADPKLHAPPRCSFQWGPFSFYGMVSAVSAKYTMFTEQGKPVRATVSLTMRQIAGAAGDKASPRESPDRTKRRILSQDTELWALAHELYYDAGAWRPIAEANGIKNPRRVYPGMVLSIPALTGDS